MAALQRGRKYHYQRRRTRRRRRRQQWRSRKILSRRRLYSRRRRKARTRRVIRFARSHYRKRRLPMTRRFNKRMRNNVLSSQKAKRTTSSYRTKAYHRKPSRVGRPRKKKHCTRIRSVFLQRKLKRRISKKRAMRNNISVEKKAKRKTRISDDEVFYSLGNSSGPKATSEEKQPKKHSVRFTTPTNAKTKEMESHSQEELPSDNQQDQQTVIPKKRSRHSATPNCKSR